MCKYGAASGDARPTLRWGGRLARPQARRAVDAGEHAPHRLRGQPSLQVEAGLMVRPAVACTAARSGTGQRGSSE